MGNFSYFIFESIKDSIIQGKNCKIVHKVKHLSDNSIIDKGFDCFYSESQKVFQFINGQFYVLYDFGAKKGDQWVTRIPFIIGGIPDDTLRTINVDSTSKISIGIDTLKVLYVSSIQVAGIAWYYKNPIIEKIGAGYMFMVSTETEDMESYYLRCYLDSSISYKTLAWPCDTIINNSISLNFLNQKIEIYPNPAHDVIHIDFPIKNQLPFQIGIFDLTGKCIINQILPNHSTDISLNVGMLNSGVYFLSVYLKNNKIYKLIIIKKQ